MLTKDELLNLPLGYLTGRDLVRFCPFQLLIKANETDDQAIQQGTFIAYSEVINKLRNRYDVAREISNANQFLINQSGNFIINIPANTFVSNIYIKWNNPYPIDIDGQIENLPLQMTSEGYYSEIEGKLWDNSPTVQIGSTSGASDIMINQHIGRNGVVFNVNKLYLNPTTFYFTTTNGNIDVNFTANCGIIYPPVYSQGILNQTGQITFAVPANTYIYQIFAQILLNTPSIQIGTTFNGSDILPLTLVNNNILPILNQMFTSLTTLYINITGGSVNLKIDEGLNFIAPTPSLTNTRELTLVKILSIFAIKNILGDAAGISDILKAHFEWADMEIEKIYTRQSSLLLYESPSPLRSRGEMIKSTFNTLG